MSEVESYSVYSSEDECGDGQEPKMFEPDPRLIARLYCEIKKNKTLSLDWKCEGQCGVSFCHRQSLQTACQSNRLLIK